MNDQDIIIVRSLTDSDMGLFSAHRKATASRQRAIALTTPATERLLDPAVIAARGGDFDCITSFGSITNREVRRINKGGKNWRLGGRQFEAPIFGDLDSRDFALLRSVKHNDGSSPILLTFVGRRSHRFIQAGLAAMLSDGALQHNVALFQFGEQGFDALAELFPPVPACVAVRPASAIALGIGCPR
ncbi:hypothetical protein [Sinorhizobium sp. BG8]|uniref:hypothetical protein n=1 Tax=Sinorhizobium sp. BG8 TaxID=2613773 RepID=UPI00193CA35E|nr:hypothetical protein [Sinorhizobium sp. BG8]QRM56401.1 hypothetical protein F3Y30_19055 [Sinorhizobium sp. BG8]